MRPPQPPPLLLLGSYRSEEADRSPFLRAVSGLADGGLAASRRWELAVEPLTLAESSELALELLGQTDAASMGQAHAIASESKGNPLFIYELVNYVQGGEALAQTPGSAGQIDLDAVLWSRINRLPERTRWLLEDGRGLGATARAGPRHGGSGDRAGRQHGRARTPASPGSHFRSISARRDGGLP